MTYPVERERPTFDVRLWCNECGKVIGTVRDVPDNNPSSRVERAMVEHVVIYHPLTGGAA